MIFPIFHFAVSCFLVSLRRGAVFLSGAVLISAALFPVLAEAHGPSRQKVSEKIVIKAPPEDVWAAIADFDSIVHWHPAVASVVAEGGNQPGATRILTLGNGGVIEEKLEKYQPENMRYFYRITKVAPEVLPVNSYSSWMIVTPVDGGSQIEWKGAFYRGFMGNDPPPELSDEASKAAVSGVYQAGLESLKTAIESR